MVNFVQKKHIYWQEGNGYIGGAEPRVFCSNQNDFTDYINKELGINKSKSSIMRAVRGEIRIK